MLESILYDVKPRELLHLIKYMNIFCCCQSFPKWKEYIFMIFYHNFQLQLSLFLHWILLLITKMKSDEHPLLKCCILNVISFLLPQADIEWKILIYVFNQDNKQSKNGNVIPSLIQVTLFTGRSSRQRPVAFKKLASWFDTAYSLR